MKIKVITIDFWNTLFDSQDGFLRNQSRLKVLFDTLFDMNIEFDEKKLINVLKYSWQYYNNIWQNMQRTPDAREILSHIWEKMHFSNNPAALDYIVDFFEKSILYFPPDLQPFVENILPELSQKYQLAIISDSGFSPGKIMRKLMQNKGIDKYFSTYSFSDETGFAKPHKIAFMAALDALNCTPDNALHIGDIERTDILGAKSIGMKAIRYDGDPDSELAAQKPLTSVADYIAKDWNEIERIINNF